MKKTVTLIFFIALSNILVAQVSHFSVGDTLQFSKIKTMSGSHYDVDELESELLVMNFWNIGCRGCVQEMPFLNKVHTEMKDDPITFWSITLNHESNISEYLAKHPIKWEIKGNVDFTGNFSESQFDIKCMPTTIVINKEKEILYAKCGPILDDENGKRFVKLLKTGQPWE